MRVDEEKAISEFTDKQREALQACMAAAAQNSGGVSKSNLLKAIRASEAYDRKQDARKALKAFLKNKNVPLDFKSGKKKVERTDMRVEE